MEAAVSGTDRRQPPERRGRTNVKRDLNGRARAKDDGEIHEVSAGEIGKLRKATISMITNNVIVISGICHENSYIHEMKGVNHKNDGN
jgi:hypothetical protein